MKLVLGLDMATHNSGVALLSTSGELIDHKNIYGGDGDTYKRCRYIYDQLDSYIKAHQDIAYVAMEDTLLNKFVPNLNACRDLITLKGFIMGLVHSHKLELNIYTANNWKSSAGILTGPEGRDRGAQKLRSVRRVKEKFGIDVDDNQADAINIALVKLTSLKL